MICGASYPEQPGTSGYRSKISTPCRRERSCVWSLLKRLMRSAMSEDHEEHIQRQYLELLLLFQTKDFQEGLHSYLEKRPANFEGQ